MELGASTQGQVQAACYLERVLQVHDLCSLRPARIRGSRRAAGRPRPLLRLGLGWASVNDTAVELQETNHRISLSNINAIHKLRAGRLWRFRNSLPSTNANAATGPSPSTTHTAPSAQAGACAPHKVRARPQPTCSGTSSTLAMTWIRASCP